MLLNNAVESLGMAGALLSSRDDDQAIQLKQRLKATTDALTAAERNFGKVMHKNDPAYDKAKDNIESLRRQTRSLTKEVKRSNVEFKKQNFAVSGFGASLTNMARSYLSIFAIFTAGGAIFRASKDFERISATMLLASGSAEQAAVDMEFIREKADYLGADIIALSDAFAGFNVSALSAGVTADKSKEIFNDLAVSVQATGLDAHRSGLAFLAFKQMLAGPVVQAQEMNQVVEQMPQFTGIARKALKALGHEGENFRQIIATGTVDSKEFVTTVAKMMAEQAKSTGAAEASRNNIVAAQNRMNNSFKDFSKFVSEAGLKDILRDIFNGVANVVKAITPATVIAVKAVSMLTGVISGALKPLNELLQKMGLDGGLASILVFIGGFLAAGSLIKGIKALIDVVKLLGKTTMISQAIATGGASLIPAILGGTAAAIGAEAIFNGTGLPGSGSSSKSTSTENNIEQNFHITTQQMDEMKLARLTEDATVRALN